MHYRRQYSGKPLEPTRQQPAFGEYGLLAESGDEVQCHICGQWREALGWHVARVHDISARDYKLQHGLPLQRGLISAAVRDRKSEQAKAQVGSAGWKRLEAKRDPDAAQKQRTVASHASAAQHLPAEVSRANSRRRVVVRTCVVCGAQWCNLADASARVYLCGAACVSAWRSIQAYRGGPQSTEHGQAQVRAVKAWLDEGLTVSEMAQRMGVTTTRIRQIQKHIQAAETALRTSG